MCERAYIPDLNAASQKRGAVRTAVDFATEAAAHGTPIVARGCTRGLKGAKRGADADLAA